MAGAKFVFMQDTDHNEYLKSLQANWSIQVNDSDSEADLLRILSARVNYLIENDFPHLVSLLYRVDVSEKKIRLLLKENPESDSGNIIAHLIIEREKEKIKTRRQFNRREDGSNDDDRW